MPALYIQPICRAYLTKNQHNLWIVLQPLKNVSMSAPLSVFYTPTPTSPTPSTNTLTKITCASLSLFFSSFSSYRTIQHQKEKYQYVPIEKNLSRKVFCCRKVQFQQYTNQVSDRIFFPIFLFVRCTLLFNFLLADVVSNFIFIFVHSLHRETTLCCVCGSHKLLQYKFPVIHRDVSNRAFHAARTLQNQKHKIIRFGQQFLSTL